MTAFLILAPTSCVGLPQSSLLDSTVIVVQHIWRTYLQHTIQEEVNPEKLTNKCLLTQLEMSLKTAGQKDDLKGTCFICEFLAVLTDYMSTGPTTYYMYVYNLVLLIFVHGQITRRLCKLEERFDQELGKRCVGRGGGVITLFFTSVSTDIQIGLWTFCGRSVPKFTGVSKLLPKKIFHMVSPMCETQYIMFSIGHIFVLVFFLYYYKTSLQNLEKYRS